MLYKAYTNKSFLINTLEYIIAFFLILQCNSLFMYSGSNSSRLLSVILRGIIILIFIIGLLNINKYHTNLYHLLLFLILFLFIMTVFLILNFYIYHYALDNIFIFLITPLAFIIYLYSFVDKNDGIDTTIFFKIENIILVLAFFSLIIWILVTFNIIMPNTYIISNWFLKDQIVSGYYNVLYVTQGNINFLGLNLLRNSGIFTESPMYSYVLFFALLIELFMKNNKLLNYRVIILFLTIITTTSSSGMMMSIFALLFAYFTGEHKNKEYVILIFMLMIPIVIFLFNITIMNKIGPGTNRDISFILRYDDILSSIKTWGNHLIIGNGMGNFNSIVSNMSTWRILTNFNTGLSTGFFSSLAYGGIILGSFYIFPTVLVMNSSSKFKGLAIFSFIFSLFAMVSTSFIYILLLSYFWVKVINNKELQKYN